MRGRVLEIIDGERRYQDTRWDNDPEVKRQADKEKVPADWLMYMEEHLSRAKKAVYDLDPTEAMREIRKVTALGVAAMENIETPPRVGIWEGTKTQ
jgi:hypothetical protein